MTPVAGIFIFAFLPWACCQVPTRLNLAVILPDVAGSQLLFSQRVAYTLADAGHNVTLIRLQVYPYKMTTSTTRADIREWIVDGSLPDFDGSKLMDSRTKTGFEEASLYSTMVSVFQFFSGAAQMITGSCKKILADEKFMNDMKAANFDVVFTHQADFCPFGIAHVTGAKSWVWLNSGPPWDHLLQIIGLFVPPSYSPPASSDMPEQMTFMQRVKSVIGHKLTQHFVKTMVVDEETKIFRQIYGAGFPDLLDLAKKTPLLFVNSNELYDFPRPTLHKIINIGGIGMTVAAPKNLPEKMLAKIKDYDSVIVFSFGSIANASIMPLPMKRAFMAAFQAVPKTVFFVKYTGNDMDDYVPDNVQLMDWLPQTDLLNHEKTRAFITHGGFNSIQEAITFATPLLTFPLFGDQFRNSRMVEKQGMGLNLAKSETTPEKITHLLDRLINEASFRQTMVKMQQMVKKQPFSAEQRLVKWTEFVAEFKTLDNLVPHSVDMDYITLNNIDVYGFFLGIFMVILYLKYLALRMLCRRCFGSIQQNKSKKE